MEPPQICYTLVCVMVGCCSVIAGGLAEGCNINWSRMKVDPASKKRVFGTEFVELDFRCHFQDQMIDP